MDSISQEKLLVLIAPLIALQLLLTLISLIMCVRSKDLNGPKIMWVLIILLGSLIGPVLFFAFGRRSS
ncbi:PLDc N-terminal domain-containing protein [Paenibacillus oenotherae]|uniref:PLDc N-terminal domain-containing protein n=1 Tax=Paenibacillus oenotherae TaxID=1435645 RepID=A0ABS7DA86_9BACL|nr:PLDc N-terminal domain-containing protein [Paenibacillus oenotherae]MBW7476412.1 PLDc N-terminal domain-containing protein [Paenibacillus oenotherae]